MGFLFVIAVELLSCAPAAIACVVFEWAWGHRSSWANMLIGLGLGAANSLLMYGCLFVFMSLNDGSGFRKLPNGALVEAGSGPYVVMWALPWLVPLIRGTWLFANPRR